MYSAKSKKKSPISWEIVNREISNNCDHQRQIWYLACWAKDTEVVWWPLSKQKTRSEIFTGSESNDSFSTSLVKDSISLGYNVNLNQYVCMCFEEHPRIQVLNNIQLACKHCFPVRNGVLTRTWRKYKFSTFTWNVFSVIGSEMFIERADRSD